MSNLTSFSSMTTILQTSNIIWQSVSLTDELKINLEYDTRRGLLNIFVKNTSNNKEVPCCINVLSNQSEDDKIVSNLNVISSDIQQDVLSDDDDDEPKICYELSTIYSYDIIDENEITEQIDFSQTEITSSLSSSLSSSSCFDEQTIDNDDDGYSTHSLDDVEQPQHQQQWLAIPPSKLIIPSFSSQHHYYDYYSEQYVSPIRRLIEQLTWLNPFKKTMHETMIMNHIFD
ncbi:unnamed protein product [Adineta steineri]|uniref:Uncharacterized protein n=1 Tax=Adineta steineri TaxID=433720 RepID=A0A814Q0N0_9BILA|nr:unnamed protein product [Adineta steineri]